ncbi:hypothetical protein N7520_008896 [Penicillium odoratum]|uniref:uncharacterized protein n=1 Tax=Penicillium odoratum TaxID=1167516 RepID=UPI002548DE01|nr:uncharacterized protein N7520_008896 [Penicillium odoratum]KAJ5751979.1 hypothetical protein N7520_008896 [Penicillium odoratum]
MRALSKGIEIILQLKSLIKSETEYVNLIDRVHDASGFALYHQAAIKSFPLQVYASALVFSPAKSITRIQYQAQEPVWIVNHQDIGDEWSPCLQTLEGHSNSVKSVYFSHDSSFIASASSDRTVKIWDTSSGQCLTTLNGLNEAIVSLCLSHDSKILASASADSTIRIWNRSSEKCRIKSADGRAISLVFSYDLKFIKARSTHNTTRLWDVNSGQCMQTFKARGRDLVEFFNPSLKLFDGSFHLPSFFVDGPNWQTYDAWSRSEGYGIKCLLWLPPEYRPHSMFRPVVSDSKICISCSSGRVIFFTFDSAALLDALAAT